MAYTLLEFEHHDPKTIDEAASTLSDYNGKAKIIAGGSEPHVPGQIGSQPSPKQETSNLFIVAEG